MILVGIMPVFTFALGTWQLQRLRWKINLIDELEERLELEPLPLPPKIKFSLFVSSVMFICLTSPSLSVIPEFVYRRVLLRGKWDGASTMFLSPRVREGVHGFHVIMPLVREHGSTVLVDRGFVSREFVNSVLELETGEVEVLGMLRTSQKRNVFTPDNKPADGQWYWAEVDKMAEYAGGEKAGVQPVLIEEIFGKGLISDCTYSEKIKEGHAGEASTRISKGIPVGRTRTVELRNSHLSYVITW